ncbi:MAG TPA: RIP metalloprotease RseP [Methylotenera sp.]|nr:RIP metalloprotease RseP [Methylotenera sp.]
MLNALLTVAAFIFTLGLLVTIHEYGHYQVAKWCGVKVLKFSIGFGKPFFTKKVGRDQTEFVLAAIPLGGYVKMLDEHEVKGTDEYALHDMSRALNRQSVAKRMAIVVAGSGANLLLAILFYWILFLLGVVGLKPIIGHVSDNSPAAIASMNRGETIQSINGKPVTNWQEARWIFLKESLKSDSVEVLAVNNNSEAHLHQLDLSGFKQEDFETDILEKLGLSVYQPDIPARVGDITHNSPAAKAGLQVDDLILSINHKKVSFWEDFVQEIRRNPKVDLEVVVQRGNQEVTLHVIPDTVVENRKKIGRIGASFKLEPHELDALFVTTHYSIAGALIQAIEKTWDTALFSLKMIGNMLTGQVSWKSMSGPVSIANYAGQSANMGLKVFIGFLAVISISIGVLNLLPIPVLDGGHFMYYMAEIFTGKPVSEATMIIGQKVGFTLLGCMMVLALYNDINRLITG